MVRCANGGRCAESETDGFSCICLIGFYGRFCQKPDPRVEQPDVGRAVQPDTEDTDVSMIPRPTSAGRTNCKPLDGPLLELIVAGERADLDRNVILLLALLERHNEVGLELQSDPLTDGKRDMQYFGIAC